MEVEYERQVESENPPSRSEDGPFRMDKKPGPPSTWTHRTHRAKVYAILYLNMRRRLLSHDIPILYYTRLVASLVSSYCRLPTQVWR